MKKHTIDIIAASCLLRDYSDWLHKKGYIDSDYYTEEPLAVDTYINELFKTKPKKEK